LTDTVSPDVTSLQEIRDSFAALAKVAMLLAEARELPVVLQRSVQLIAEAIGAKAASLRLVDKDHDELVIRAVYNLSNEYLKKGPVHLSRAEVDRIALSDAGHAYVRNMATDRRILYPDDAAREGIVSLISVGMRYKGKPVGVLRVYTGAEREFTPFQIDLVKAIAAQAAVAIENARLFAETIEAAALERQVRIASEVQHRMLPQHPPIIPGVDLASIYEPCHALGGDFFDFIELPYQNVGLAIADVSGKGVPASLIMASVRAALRAQVDNVYFVDEVMRRLNEMLCRDTMPSEFVTLFYGVLDVPNRRLTYCNAGHPPALLLRGGEVSELPVGNMLLGITCDESYAQATVDLQPGDTLLMYTDGLLDVMNFQQQRFGRARVVEALKQSAGSADTVVQNILWTARKFAGIQARNDDITMIVAKL